MTETERKNLVATLNLEYGATKRYELQVARMTSPRAVALLEGVRRNEADHVGEALRALERESDGSSQGFRTLELHLKLNLEFEKEAVQAYTRFSREAEDPALREVFRGLLKAEVGHVRVFEQLLKEIAEGRYPKVFLCPLCGWEIDYGAEAGAGAVQKCDKCGARFALALEAGDFVLRAA
jgi:rubrerythrin